MSSMGSQQFSTHAASQRQWLRVRKYLQDNRYRLSQSAAGEYPDAWKVAGTSLLTTATWLPAEPLPLDMVDLEFEPNSDFPGLTDSEGLAESVRPIRPNGTRYANYSAAMADLDAPAVFEDRSTYRLLAADLSGSRGLLRFGRGSYFDGIDIGEAAAHEHAAVLLGEAQTERLRSAVGPPFSPVHRPINVAISTLTVRYDRVTGDASYLLHWRDPARVGHAGGLYQVLPVGVFQASGEQPWNERNDFSLWRCMIREYAEELLGKTEDHGSDRKPIDYGAWPFAVRVTRALDTGQIRPYCLGLGVDPLTFATDLLTVVVFDASVFDELFGNLATRNAEGPLETSAVPGAQSAGIAFTGDEIERLTQREPMQAAGAALLALAWRHRQTLLR